MEMGDKTQLTAFALSIRFRSPLKVFLGVITGLTGVTLLAVLVGLILKETIDFQVLKPIIGGVFCLGGVILMGIEIKRLRSEKIRICPTHLDLCEKSRENCPQMDNCELYFESSGIRKGVFIRSAFLMFTAELGDKTMLMGVGLATQLNPIGVFLGALIALAVVNSLGVFAGEKIAQKVPRKILGFASGFLFLITGILIFYS